MRLLLVHGSLDAYRLSRLIKYSFYKNVVFGFMLFFFQFYCGFSGQAMVDDITAAAFNVLFTSIPIMLFAIMDRPIKKLDTLVGPPGTKGRGRSRERGGTALGGQGGRGGEQVGGGRTGEEGRKE